VDVAVGLGPDETSFAIQVALTVHAPGLDQAAAEKLTEQAHQLCPYSKATRGNVPVTLTTTV
jgi:organic hydroperoxide reductase OsmC/OhrA